MTEQDVREMLRRRAGDATTAPDAWERIAERIAGDETAPAVLELAPGRARFGRPVVLGSIAATLLLVVASLALVQDQDGKETIRAADNPTPAPSGEREPTSIPADRPATSGPPLQQSFEGAGEAAAHQWARALAAGDADVAWDVLAEQSRKSIGGRSGFDARLNELKEGWGAWGGAPDVSYRYRAVSLMDEAAADGELPLDLPRLGVVILSAAFPQEGMASFETKSLPVRGTPAKAQVDPFSDVGIELSPDPVRGGKIAAGTRMGAYTPGSARVWFVLDDRRPVAPDLSESADGDQQHVTLTPVPPLSSGQHSFTVVVLTVDGRLASSSTTYTVA